MAYDRIEQLDDNQLVTTVDGLVKDLEAIKARQLVGGDVITPIILTSANEFDVVSHLSGAVYIASFTLTFTADHQVNPYIYPIIKIYTMAGVRIPLTSMTIFGVDYATQYGPLNGNWDDGKEYVDVYSSQNVQYKLKIYLQASDTGSFTLQEY